jgi:light-regulated signal transduction histidine kinase (bacteriophytochrome)
MSIFERAMVTAVLWFTLLLCWQRMLALKAVALQSEALEQKSRELARSNADLGSFASIVAHDLRGPLSAMALFTDLVAEKCAGKVDSECEECISSLRSEVDDMASMIQGLLSYARVGNGKVQASACDMESVLVKVLTNLSSDLEAGGAKMTHEPLPVVSGDPNQLSRLLQNLIENAIKYRGDAAPRIHLAAAAGPDGWTFSMRDNGIGISALDAKKIFHLFERGSQNRSQSPGAGIGLAICKRIVERHGGRIWVESSPGQGATFYFTISNQPESLEQPILH